MRPVINSDKRYVSSTLFTLANGTTAAIVIVDAKQDPDPNLSNDVQSGTIVKAVFLEYWVLGEGQQPFPFQLIVEKVPQGGTGIVFADSQSLTFYSNKKNVLYTTQGVVGDANSNPIPFIRMWVKIPKGKQRFGNGDRLVVNVTNLSAQDDGQLCGQGLFKAYT